MSLPDTEHRLPPAAADDFLNRIDELVDWTALVSAMEALSKQAGRALPLSVVKVALLKQWYDFSDSLAEFTILDRISFRDFVEFKGDGSGADAEILSELRTGTWTELSDFRPLLDAVEQQLRDRGFTVRPGYIVEASIVPCTEGELTEAQGVETAIARPGEMGRMLEAVTAKAHAQGRMPTGPQSFRRGSLEEPAGERDVLEPMIAGDWQKVQNGPIRAQIEWPWGQISDLIEMLPIGRDYAYSPLARELTPFTHVSRRHAELFVHGDSVWIKDLGSRNGTYVNNEEVQKGQVFLIDTDSIVRFGPLLTASVKIFD
jgi:hypothetical protein